MTFSAGDSIVGYQILIFGVDRAAAKIYLECVPTWTEAPDRVGYWYLLVAANSNPVKRVIVDRGPLNKPGLLKVLPVLGTSEGDTLEFAANWNESGIPWFIFMGS